MNRIVLINPPSPFLENDAAYPPSGLLYLAAAIEQAGAEVAVVDLAGNRDWPALVSADVLVLENQFEPVALLGDFSLV